MIAAAFLKGVRHGVAALAVVTAAIVAAAAVDRARQVDQ